MNNSQPLTEAKPWYASRGILGPVVSAGALVAGWAFGVKIDAATQAYIVDQGAAIATGVVTIAGIVTGIIGRLRATKKIG